MINVLWDLDGTVVDSMPIIAACLNKTAVHYGVKPWQEDRIRPLIGPELGEILSTILDTDDAAEKAAAKDVYRSFYEIAMLNSPLFVGISDVLNHFKDIGAKQFIATAKYQVYAEEIIDVAGLSSVFTGIYGSTKDGKYGDKKELLAWLIDEEGLKPSETVMIGDTRYDIEAGRHHDLTTLGVLWGYSDQATLTDVGAHHCVEKPDQIVEVVRHSIMCAC